MKQLVELINQKTSAKPLIFFCREVERAIGLETVLENYHIACVEDSAIVDQLLENGVSVFCLEREIKNIESKSTNHLLNDSKLKTWIEQIAKGNGFYAMTFLPSQTIKFKVEKLGGELLANDYEMYLKFENKILAAKFFAQNNIQTPKNIVKKIDEIKFSGLFNLLSLQGEDRGEGKGEHFEKFVLQLDRAHTGSGTFIIENENEFLKLQEEFKGNEVKFSEYINGKTYTLNVCITENRNFVGPVQYQIPGVPELTTSSGTTVGNDFVKAKQDLENSAAYEKIKVEIEKLSLALKNIGYRGLFGIDLMIDQSENVYIIEINARQTANIPFQTQIELKLGTTPLALISVGSWLGINVDSVEYKYLKLIEKGSQLFLRALNDSTKIDFEPKSGEYKLLSDNSAINWESESQSEKDNVIFLDSANDKPLVFQKISYRLDRVENAFLLHFSRIDNEKNRFEEICRMQFLEGIIDENDKIKPWILEAMREIRKIVTVS
jgi:glutathione synthase/RimK-type ligase-like ATP-grasp enzyme